MGRSYTNVILHIIFHVKSTGCPINEEDLEQVYRYIAGIVKSVSGFVYTVGGRPDHIHLLGAPSVEMCLSDFVRTIKASSSKWIKSLHAHYRNFCWQEGYAAFAVSESQKHSVMNYINQQKEHHKNRSTRDEFIQFLKKNGFATTYVP